MALEICNELLALFFFPCSTAIENELVHASQLSNEASGKCLFVFRTLEDFPQNVENQEMHNLWKS